MSKDKYFEMCDMLGSDPIEAEIPVVIEDLPELVQLVFEIYSVLVDTWDPVNGTYSGKDFTILFNLLGLYSIEEAQEQLLVIDILKRIDAVRSKLSAEKQKQKNPAR